MLALARWSDALRQDALYALRGLRRERRFAAMVIATLALGVGANAALFSLADRLFLRQPAGVANPEQLRRLYRRTNATVGNDTQITDIFSYAGYAAMRDAFRERASAAAYTPPDSFRIGDDERAPWVRGVYASSELLPLLGARAAIGRTFTAEEDRLDSPTHVAVIAHSLWTAQFSGDTSILGRTVTIARQRYTIIGVMPKHFTGIDLDPVDVWVPIATFPSRPNQKTPWYNNWQFGDDFRVIARGTASGSDAWVSAVATTAFRRGQLANVHMYPDTGAILTGPVLAALGPTMTPKTEVAITTRLVGVALIVLLIACANVANLLLGRALNRRREFAVRIALGVSRRRLLALPMIDGLLLALASAAVAILAAAWGGVALQRMVLPSADAAGAAFDWKMIGVALGLAVITGVAASVVPAWRALTPNLTNALKAGAREGRGTKSRLRSSLVVLQAALSVVLLVGAGLFVRSLNGASAIDLGIDVDRVVFGSVKFYDPANHYLDRSSHFVGIATALRAIEPRVAAMRGVEQVALTTTPPLHGYAMIGLYLDGGRHVPLVDEKSPAMTATSPAYFATIGLRVVSGRVYTDADNAIGEHVVVVNEMAARTYWPGESPLGKCIMVASKDAPCARVIGVVRDAHFDDVVEKPLVGVYFPTAQYPDQLFLGNPIFIIVRSAPGMSAQVANDLRRVLRETFPAADPPEVTVTSERVSEGLRPWRLGASLFSVFGVLALLVAAIGVYSVIAYSVTQRTHEMGVRIALGARTMDVLRLVTSEGLRLVVIGIAIGVAVALALGGLVQSMLYGVSAADPLVMAVVVALLTAVAIVAALIPARRAARVDPAIALRAE
jgi:predicted permease